MFYQLKHYLSIYLSLILKGFSKKLWKTAQLPEEWDFILFQLNLTKSILMEVRNTLLNQVLSKLCKRQKKTFQFTDFIPK